MTRRFFLVSTLWLQSLLSFLNNYDVNSLDKYFDPKSFYFANENYDLDEKTCMNSEGIYPGPVNNYNIIDFVDYWEDPDPDYSYTNSYFRKGIQENYDFLFLNYDVYNYLKTHFKYNFEIERRLINKNDCEVIELELLKVIKNIDYDCKKVKLIILSEYFTDKQKSQLKLKYIQISKMETLGEFKKKIFRVYGRIDKNFKIDDVKMFIPEMSKSEVHDLIISYNNEVKNFPIQGVEVKDENNTLVEVRNIYINL